MAGLGGVLYWLVIAGVLVGESLLILWAATSTRPRLVRALVVWVTIVMLMAIDAKGPALVFAVTAAMTWAIIAWVQRFTGVKQPGWHFQIGDLFIAILFVGTMFALLREISAPWSFRILLVLPIFGLPLAPVIALAYLSVTGSSWPRMIVGCVLAILVSARILMGVQIEQALHIGFLIRLVARPRNSADLHLMLLVCLLVCLLVAGWCARTLWTKRRSLTHLSGIGYFVALSIAAGLAVLLVARYSDEFWSFGATDILSELRIIGVYAIPAITIAAFIAFVTWIGRLDWGQLPPARRQFLQRAGALAAAILLLPSAWLYWQMLWPTPFPPPPEGSPNNYAQIVAIGKELKAMPWYGSSDGGLPREFKPKLDEVVRLLDAPNFTPTEALEALGRRDFSHPLFIMGHDDRILTRGLQTYGEELRRMWDLDRAVDYSLALLHYDSMNMRGGAHPTAYFPGYGAQLLCDSRKDLSADQIRRVLQEIEQAIRDRDPAEVMMQRQEIFWKRESKWQGRLTDVLAPLGKPLPGEQLYRNPYHNSEASLRSVQVLFAVQLFQTQHQRIPAELSELTPEILTQIPLDPFSGQPLQYSAGTSDYQLYSVGLNSIDEGGKGDDIDLSRAECQN